MLCQEAAYICDDQAIDFELNMNHLYCVVKTKSTMLDLYFFI